MQGQEGRICLAVNLLHQSFTSLTSKPPSASDLETNYRAHVEEADTPVSAGYSPNRNCRVRMPCKVHHAILDICCCLFAGSRILLIGIAQALQLDGPLRQGCAPAALSAAIVDERFCRGE